MRQALAALTWIATGCGGITGAGEFEPIGTVQARHVAGAQARWLNVDNPIGSVRIAPAPEGSDEITVRAEVAVRSTIHSRFSAADAARDLVLEEKGEIVTLKSGHCAKDERSLWKLDLVIEAPARLQQRIMQDAGTVDAIAAGNSLIVNLAAGTIDVAGAPAHVELVVVTGSVKARVERIGGGLINATAGKIELEVREAGPKDSLSLSTTTGDVSVSLPKGVDLEVELSTGVGGVEVEGAPDLKRGGGLVGGRASGFVGRGGPRLTASAGTGNVRFTVRR